MWPILPALIFCVVVAGGVHADSSGRLQSLIEQSIQAYQSGEPDRARRLAREADALARALPAAMPAHRANAFVNHARILELTNEDPAAVERLLTEALDLLADADAVPSEPWLLASELLARHEVQDGRDAAARSRATDIVHAARPTQWRAQAAAIASSIRFELGDYPEAATLLQEALAVDEAVLAATYGNVFVAYAKAQEQAEAEKRIDDAAALIDGRLAILAAFPMEPGDAYQRTVLFGKVLLFYEGGRYGAAADALREWGAVGSATPEEIAFIDQMATTMLEYTQLSHHVEHRTVQLDHAELAVAFGELLGDPSDPRLGFALRARAAAEKAVGRVESSTQSLRKAAEVLSRSEAGRFDLHLVLSDLAANAWHAGDLQMARDLYEQSDAAYRAALASGVPALGAIDRAIEAVNRANLLVDLGEGAQALHLAAKARTLLQQDALPGQHKWNDRAQFARIEAVEARALADLGRTAEAVATALSAADFARQVYPAGHPDLALALVNAGDLVAALGEPERGIPLMQEGADIIAGALPEIAPQVLGAQFKLALVHLTAGDHPAARSILRRVTEARKAPAYREALPDAAFEFETLAWLNLEHRQRDDLDRLDEAFEALQWTHITRSAEALSMLEARFALADAGLAPVLRRRQDLVEEHRRTTSSVLSAHAGDRGATAATLAAMNARLEQIDMDLRRIDTDLSALGLEMAGLSSVRPMSIGEVQARLAPGEGLVTFVLPGLRPDRVAGLAASSNRVFLVTRDTVAVGTIAETSRAGLRDRVRAFRCSVAISDPGCGRNLAADLRGAMVEGTGEDAGAYFDYSAAHRLYLDLFGGVAHALQELEHLIIVPPADLLHLPFSALITSAEGPDKLGEAHWLIRDHAVSVLPSIPSLRTLRAFDTGAPSGRYLGVGDPTIGIGSPIDCDRIETIALRAQPDDRPYLLEVATEHGLRLADPEALRAMPRLPDTACELRAISRLFPPGGSDLLLGPAAREVAVKRLSSEGTLRYYDVIVFATHGLTAGESGAAAPGLVMTPPDRPMIEDDGLLTAGEIATLDLTARIVVLSACNTAAGEQQAADGLSGIARAFFHAGARAVLVTLWAVYSEASLQVSIGLLSELTPSGFDGNGAMALRRTLLGIIDSPAAGAHRQHPSYWAPFTLVGAN